jgi:hypothetical protein
MINRLCNRLAPIPGEAYVIGVDDGQVVIDGGEFDRQRMAARLPQCARPELVEIARLSQLRPVGAELIEGQVKLRHKLSLSSKLWRTKGRNVGPENAAPRPLLRPVEVRLLRRWRGPLLVVSPFLECIRRRPGCRCRRVSRRRRSPIRCRSTRDADRIGMNLGASRTAMAIGGTPRGCCSG